MSAIPWYKSRIILGAGVSLISKLLSVTGIIDLDDHVADQIVEGAVIAGGVVGDIVAIHARTTQTEAPVITATAAGAELVKQAQPPSEAEVGLIEDAAQAASVEVPSWMLR